MSKKKEKAVASKPRDPRVIRRPGRMMTADELAKSMGISTRSFLKGVASGVYPEPTKVTGHIRQWDSNLAADTGQKVAYMHEVVRARQG
jgi:hypothetical protein